MQGGFTAGTGVPIPKYYTLRIPSRVSCNLTHYMIADCVTPNLNFFLCSILSVRKGGGKYI